MKKSKLFLTATFVVVTVSGALAFKAKYSNDICFASVPAGGICSNAVKGTKEIDGGDLNGTTPYCYALKGILPCSLTSLPNKGNVEIEPGGF